MRLSDEESAEYTYLKVPPTPQLRSCIGLVLAGMAARAKVGVGNLEEAAELLESYHSSHKPTRYRFHLGEESVIAEVEEAESGGNGEPRWRTVVELVS